jgi:uncharacterized glyoxalase superfamily protein PhnB
MDEQGGGADGLISAHLILYVQDQRASADFYRAALGIAPRLDVPGMTEFELGSVVLGLMPEAGIQRLLGAVLPDPAQARGVPRAELYLRVHDPDACHQRALRAGARELDPVRPRDWGDRAGYLLDRDGHVLALAAADPGRPRRGTWSESASAEPQRGIG